MKPSTVRWRIVGLLLAFSFMSWFNRTSISVAYVGQIKTEFGISEEAMGAVISAFLIAYMLCMTPGGWLADRFGPWAALVVMGIGSGLFGILTGCVGFMVQPAGGIDFSLLATLTGCVSFFAQSSSLLFLFLIVRTIMGAFTAPIYPASTRIVSYWIPFHQRAMVNGMIMAAALVGIASTFHVFGTLVDSFRWPMAFAITGTFTTVLAVLWTWYAKDHPGQHRHVNPAEEIWIRGNKVSFVEAGFTAKHPPEIGILPGRRIPLWRNRSLIFLTLSYAAIGYFEYLFYFWMEYYFKEVLKLDKDTSRWYATIPTLSMAVGMASGGWLSDRLQRVYGYRRGRVLVPVGGMLAGAALLGLGLLPENPNWIVVWFSLAMAAVGATEGPFWATAIDLGGRHGATSAGIFNTGGNAGGAIAPILTPIVSKAWGWQWGIGLGSIICLAGVGFWWWIDPAEGREGEPGA